MFRLAFIALITVRVTLCPILCVGLEGNASSAEVSSTPCHCHCSNDRAPCDGSQQPTSPVECPCPCETDGLCQVTTEVHRTSSVDVDTIHELVGLCLESPDLLNRSASHCEVHPHRRDFQAGRSVRLALASLLL